MSGEDVTLGTVMVHARACKKMMIKFPLLPSPINKLVLTMLALSMAATLSKSAEAEDTPTFLLQPQATLPVTHKEDPAEDLPELKELKDNKFTGLEKTEEQTAAVNLHGSVSIESNIFHTPAKRIHDLVSVAVANDPDIQRCNEKSGTNLRGLRYFKQKGKEILQFSTSATGFEQSSEAADVILDEKVKLKSQSAIEYVRQRREDYLHTKICAGMMQMAMGLGLKDQERRERAIASGLQELEKYVGEKEAQDTLAALNEWTKSVKMPTATFAQEPWDVIQMQQKSASIVEAALQNDSVISEIQKRLHKYNKMSTFRRATGKIVHAALEVCMWSPTIVSPAAQLSQLIFVELTGGPEEAKLLKEVYLDKRLDCRITRLTQEATSAINLYNFAIVSKNPALLACAESMMAEMGGMNAIQSVAGKSALIPKNAKLPAPQNPQPGSSKQPPELPPTAVRKEPAEPALNTTAAAKAPAI